MPKFRIEMELQDINDRILIANFDSENNKTESMTFNEELAENENDQFNLTFSIANKFGRTDLEIGSYISVGRPLWLHLDDQNKSIRMTITSFSTVIGAENIIYNVEAVDYASSVFSKNNVGLTFDSISSTDYLDFKEQRTLSDSSEVLVNYILERGWLRKHVSGTTYEGWKADFVDYDPDPDEDGFVNVSLSGSNTYNALITIANLSFRNIEIDYETKTFYFIDRNAAAYQTEYTLRNGFNLQNFSLNYSSENLYGLFYIEGGENVDQNFITLSEAIDYKDNFLFDLSYFEDKNLIDSDPLTSSINNLTEINENLSRLIGDKLTKEIQISDYRATVRAEAEETMVPDGQENYILVDSLFKTKDFGDSATGPETINVDYEVPWNNLISENYNSFKFPIKVSYRSSSGQIIEEIIEKEEGEDWGILSNGLAKIFFEQPTPPYTEFVKDGLTIYFQYQSVEWGPYKPALTRYGECTSTSPDCDSLSDFGNIQIVCETIATDVFSAQARVCEYTFKPENLKILWVTGTRQEDINIASYPDKYPYFELLDEYDGSAAITKEKQMLTDEIDLWKSEWEKEERLIACIEGVWRPEDLAEEQKSECELEFGSEPVQTAKEALKDGAIQRINEYSILIGNYYFDEDQEEYVLDPTKLGVVTLIKDRFEAYESEFTTSADPIMPEYRVADKAKKDFWYNLKKDKQHIFPEGSYTNQVETTAENLLVQAKAIYSDHKVPTENFGITYIDVSDLLGINLQKLKVGQFIKIENKDYKTISTESSKIRIMSISRNLRDNANINLQISRYNLYEVIVEKLLKEQTKN